MWNEGFFTISDTFIENLVNALPRFDFAALVLTPDDLTTSREASTLSPRDNVCFNWACSWVDWDDREHLSSVLAENALRSPATLLE